MDPGGMSAEPCRVCSSTVDPEEGFVWQAWREQAPEGPLWPHATVICAEGLLDLRVGGGAVAAVAHGAARHPAGHAVEHARAAQLFAGREDLCGRGGGEAEVGAACRHGGSALRDASA